MNKTTLYGYVDLLGLHDKFFRRYFCRSKARVMPLRCLFGAPLELRRFPVAMKDVAGVEDAQSKHGDHDHRAFEDEESDFVVC